jgi:aldehyde:ferredoxin oxidoreductase
VATEVAELEQYGVSRYQVNTCIGNSTGPTFMDFGTERSERRIQASQLGAALADDYGVWGDYCQIARDFFYAHKAGLWKKYLDAKEYDAIPWKLLDDKNPAFLLELYKRWAYKDGKLGEIIADGPEFWENAWPEIKEYHNKDSLSQCVRLGIAKHHSAEDFGQVGMLTNLPYNRDGQNHTHINFSASGLPLNILKDIGKELFGTPDAVEARNDYKPMNEGKAKYAVMACLYKELHDSLTMCNWTQPLWVSPQKSKNYRGDPDAEAKFYSAVTGFKVTKDELENTAQRIFTMHRALTVRYMNEKDMRTKHDVINDWNFDYPKDAKALTPGNYKMDRADMDVARDMFYEKSGWDKKTGVPTKATLDKLGLGYVADELGKNNLLPS